jgi:hypothetical protein
MPTCNSYHTRLKICNNTDFNVILSVSEIDNYDWDNPDDRPDVNIQKKTILSKREIDEKEEINANARSGSWFSLKFQFPNNDSIEQRFNQRNAMDSNYSGHQIYSINNYIFTVVSTGNEGSHEHNGCHGRLEIVITCINPAEFKVGAEPTDIPIVGQWLDHTYTFAKHDSKFINFQCYGGASHEEKNIYIQDIGDIELARTIACNDPEDIRENYDKKMGVYRDRGDCSGVLYGAIGVCHQMTNRILYACKKHPDVFSLTHAKSTLLSYFAYGVYGNNIISWLVGWPNWRDYLAGSIKKLNEHRMIKKSDDEVKQALINSLSEIEDPFTNKAIQIELQYIDNADLIVEKRLNHLLDSTNPKGLSDLKVQHALEAARTFVKKRNELHYKKLEGILAWDEARLDFIDGMNNVFGEFLADFVAIMGNDDFKDIFGITYSDKIKLINRNYCLIK